jgi:hypothetical protein
MGNTGVQRVEILVVEKSAVNNNSADRIAAGAGVIVFIIV